ncbi:MAG: chemotaxis protein CheR, partial [Clostridia bacterium]|nr:chemotaxis protein CheR [Clostridia bacterium]
SGEEPYTLAMIINDFLKDEVTLWERSVLATDISTNVLEKAKKGIFYKEEVNKLPDLYKSKYFKKLNEDQYKLVPDIANHVVFGIFNLMTPQFPFKKKFDVIFCRNVMIYFEKDVKMKLISKFYDHLASGGYLFIGQAESIPRNETKFKYVMPAVYMKE